MYEFELIAIQYLLTHLLIVFRTFRLSADQLNIWSLWVRLDSCFTKTERIYVRVRAFKEDALLHLRSLSRLVGKYLLQGTPAFRLRQRLEKLT